MGRRAKDRRTVSIYMDREIADELDMCPNASEVVNRILAENAGQIGYMMKNDQKRLVRKMVEEVLREELPKVMKQIIDRLVNDCQIPEDNDE